MDCGLALFKDRVSIKGVGSVEIGAAAPTSMGLGSTGSG